MFCTTCGQTLEENMSFCVGCGAPRQDTAKPAMVARDLGAAVATTPSKACPFCGEQILNAAIRCRYCNSDLTTPQTRTAGGISVTAPLAATQPSIVIQNVQASPGPYPVREVKNPGVAVLLSIVFPGGGQFYNGHAGKGILVLLTCWLVIPLLWSYFDAYNSAKRINRVGY